MAQSAGNRSSLVTVVGWLDIAAILLRMMRPGFLPGRGADLMDYVGWLGGLAVLSATGVGLIMHKPFARILAVITGILLILASVLTLGALGDVHPFFAFMVFVGVAMLGLVHFLACKRLAAEKRGD